MKSVTLITLKILFPLGLVYWLIANGRLDLRAFHLLEQAPSVLAVSLIYWLLGPILLCSLRWYFLLRGMGFEVQRKDVLLLNAVGIFFNAIMPGAVGGDVVKAMYVCKGLARNGKVQVLLLFFSTGFLVLLVFFFYAFL